MKTAREIRIPFKFGRIGIFDVAGWNMVKNLSPHVVISRKGRKDYIYCYPTINGRKTTTNVSRVIMGAIGRVQVDHINGDGLDNRKSNLRICNASQNVANKGKIKSNTSGYKGVFYVKGRRKNWVSQIGKDMKLIRIGYFGTKEEAAKAYNDKALELFGEFAFLNRLP